MLDEFSAIRIDKSTRYVPISNNDVTPQEDATSSGSTTTEFARELQDQMAAFMGSIDESPDMRRELENVMKDLGEAVDSGAGSDIGRPPIGNAGVSSSDEPFHETIRKTMERMQASGDQAGVASQAEGSSDLLAQMLKDMQSDGLPGEGDAEGLNKMLLGMMEQLTNKEILYDPMKELHDKFPLWMEKNCASTGAEEMRRFHDQQRLVGEIVGRFEQKEYSDSKAEDREFIVDRMQRVSHRGHSWTRLTPLTEVRCKPLAILRQTLWARWMPQQH